MSDSSFRTVGSAKEAVPCVKAAVLLNAARTALTVNETVEKHAQHRLRIVGVTALVVVESLDAAKVQLVDYLAQCANQVLNGYEILQRSRKQLRLFRCVLALPENTRLTNVLGSHTLKDVRSCQKANPMTHPRFPVEAR